MKICLCGSARFEPTFHWWQGALAIRGHVVHSLSCYPSTTTVDLRDVKIKATLDRVHRIKILSSAAILVLNENGYIGNSTRAEINHARANNKTIYALKPLDGGSLDATLLLAEESNAA